MVSTTVQYFDSTSGVWETPESLNPESVQAVWQPKCHSITSENCNSTPAGDTQAVQQVEVTNLDSSCSSLKHNTLDSKFQTMWSHQKKLTLGTIHNINVPDQFIKRKTWHHAWRQTGQWTLIHAVHWRMTTNSFTQSWKTPLTGCWWLWTWNRYKWSHNNSVSPHKHSLTTH